MATVHLVCGFLGAGKTTFSVALARERNAVRFSVDELYLRLFADGPTYDLDQQRLDRLFAALGGLWPQVAQAGTDVVLDFGFWRRELRDHVRELAQSLGLPCRLHWLRCSDEVALERCLRRNGSPDAFLISELGYWELKVRFECLAAGEVFEIVETASPPPG